MTYRSLKITAAVAVALTASAILTIGGAQAAAPSQGTF